MMTAIRSGSPGKPNDAESDGGVTPDRSTARWCEIERLFRRALDLPAPRRTVFLANATTGDEGLRGTVEDLAEAEQGLGGARRTYRAGAPIALAVKREILGELEALYAALVRPSDRAAVSEELAALPPAE